MSTKVGRRKLEHHSKKLVAFEKCTAIRIHTPCQQERADTRLPLLNKVTPMVSFVLWSGEEERMVIAVPVGSNFES